MLTNRKLDVYVRYHGDMDGLVRVGTIAEKNLLSAAESALIDSYLQDIELKNRGVLSDVYLRKHEAGMLANCENSEVATRLERIAIHDEWQEKEGLLKRFINYIFNSQG